VTDRRLVDAGRLVQSVAAAVSGGVDLVQLREKDLPGGKLLELALALKAALSNRALLLVNERVDVALAAGADGVQLGEDALPVVAARKMLGPDALIGRSVHSVDSARRAATEGADFLVVGTIYATRSHPGEEPAGPELLRSIAAVVSLPLIGIGGITPRNLDEVMRAGARGVAVISNVLASPDPEGSAGELKRGLLARAPAVQEAPFSDD
jgi:thiamine-phosphate pyrophosphorylase